MGGPKNYNIIYVAQGGCRDTTVLTVLASEAGLNDTFCPSAGIQTLKPFRPNTQYSWQGKGINGIGNQYNPNWWSASSKTNIDTLILKSPKCTDRKFVYVTPVQVLQPDTLKFCFEDTFTSFATKGVKVSVPGGTWFGSAAVKKNGFDPRISGPGLFRAIYANKGCEDTLLIWVKNKPLIQLDTSICLNSSQLNIYKKDSKGMFWGKGIIQSSGVFDPKVAGFGPHVINYKSSEGCANQCKITVDTLVPIQFMSPTWYCNKDSSFPLLANPQNGRWSGTGVMDSFFNPAKAKQGNYRIKYQVSKGACISKDSFDVAVKARLNLVLSSKSDSVCYGKILTFEASSSGGITGQHVFKWSHGQTGSKTFYIANQSGELIGIVSDGCSDLVRDTAKIVVHPRVWFNSRVSDTVCRGQKGWAKLTLGNGNASTLLWSHDPNYKQDTLWAFADNRYRASIIDQKTGCTSDTSIEIPGYKAIQAGFSIQKQSPGDCLSPLDETALFFNQSSGGVSGTWFWGDGTQSNFSPIVNPTHLYNGLMPTYTVMLAIQNEGGCTDTAIKSLCYHDTVIYYLPNAFTPNGDGMNDEYRPTLYGATEFRMMIINRWGEMVFETRDKFLGWDGLVNGKNAPEGVYAVIIEFKGQRQSKRFDRASLTLLRPKSP
jgi:gliding motility-associated-like protein